MLYYLVFNEKVSRDILKLNVHGMVIGSGNLICNFDFFIVLGF